MLNKTIFAKAKSISYLVVVSVMVIGNLSLAPNIVLADSASVNISVATGGDAVSIDTSSASSSSAYTTLDPINISETDPNQIAVGTHVVSLPTGWEFNTSAHITAFKGDGLALASYNITPDLNFFSFTVITPSTVSTFLMLSGMQIRPTGTTPSTGGEITHSGAAIAGVTNGSTSFGTLSTVAGTITKLVFLTQPGGTVYGSTLSPQPVVKTQDQFGNDSSNGASGKIVNLSLATGSGSLIGTSLQDISSGTATFSGLEVDAVGTKQLLASSAGLASTTSSEFAITPKILTAAVTVGNKIYDGTTDATIIDVILNSLEDGDDVTITDDGTASFSDPNADTGILVTSNGVTIGGTDVGNYTFDNTATGAANIDPMLVTITPTAIQAKVYGNIDPVLAYSNSSLIGGDAISGVLGRVAGESVGSYAYALGDLSAGPNYLLSLAEGIDTFSITKRHLTIEATASSKVYDGNLASAGIPTIVSGSLADGDVANFTQVYATTNVGAGKRLTPSGTAGGNDGNNYEYVFDYKMNGAITPKELTVSGLSASDKTYDGNADATISGTPSLLGVVGADDVVLVGAAVGQFDSINAGDNAVVVSGFSISGTGLGNYTLTQPTLVAQILPLNITGSFTAADKIYDGTTTAEVLTRSLVGVLGLDGGNVSLTGGTASFSTRNLGDDLIVTPVDMILGGSAAGNYNLTSVNTTTADITVKNINVTAQTDTKVYDGNVASSVAPTVGTLAAGDSVGTAPIQAFNNKDVGTGKTLIPSDLVINDGNGGANYNVSYVTNTTGVITPRGLTVSGATTVSKSYDGNTSAAINFTSAGLVEVVPGEGTGVVNLDSSTHSAVFDNKNVGAGKTVTVSGLALIGTGKDNYSLTQPVLNDGAITKRTLNATATGNNRMYNATDVAAVDLSTDKIGGDDLILTYQAVFSGGKTVGTDKPISVTNIAILGGADQGNYSLGNTTASATANITQAPLTATVTANKKVVDGNNTATISGVTLNGILLTDVVTVNSQGMATFADVTEGMHSVTATGIMINGADADNYSFSGTATGSGEILPVPAVVYVDDGWTSTQEWTDPDGVGPATYFGYDAFTTIQEGIDAVAVGGMVNVAVGTYAESLLIEKNLGIIGDGSLKPTISGSLVNDYIVKINGATSVTLDGLEINGGGSAAGANSFNYGIFINNSGTSTSPVEIKNSTIRNIWLNGSNGVGVEGSSYALVHNNTISSFHKRGIRFINSSGKFYGNEVVGDNVDGTSRVQNLVNLWGGSNVEIYENKLHNALTTGATPTWSSPGILVTSYGGSGSSSANIHDNEIYNSDTGIIVGSVYAGVDTSSADIRGNNLHNLNWGINFEKSTVSATIHLNKFSNVSKSVNAEANDAPITMTSAIDAKSNWWGQSTGPASGTIATGIIYRPWCFEEGCTTEDGVAPTVTISSTAGSLSNASPIPVAINLSESVFDFTASDISITNGTISGGLSGSGANYTISVIPTADGAVKIDVGSNVAWDAYGNYNTAATQLSVNYDGTAPTGSVTAPVAGTKLTGTVTVTADASDATGPGVQKVEFYHSSSTDILIGTDTSSPYSVNWDSADAIDGAHDVYVIVYDNAGNTKKSVVVLVTIDHTAPVVNITSPSIGAKVNGNSVISFTNDETTSPKCSIDSTSWIDCVSGTTKLSDLTGFDALAQGTFTLYLKDTDSVGNVGTDSEVSVIKDSTAPTATSRSPAVNAVGIDPSINITVTFDEAMDSLTTVSGGLTLRKGDVEVSTSVTYDAGTKTMTINPAVTLDNNSTYTITLLSSIKDVAGNALSQTSWSFTTSASYSMNLTKGWNLISLPVVPNDKDTADVLGANSANIQSVYAYDSENGTWLVYHPSSPETSNLMTMTAGYGYWIDYTSDTPGTLSGAGNLLLEGNNVPPSRTLKSGWNLVGYYQKENTTTAKATNALKHNLDSYWTMLVSYNNTSKQMSYKIGTDAMNPGDGFWVLLSGKATDTYIYTLGDADN